MPKHYLPTDEEAINYLEEKKTKNPSLYSMKTAEFKGEQLATDIVLKSQALFSGKEPVDLNNSNEVRECLSRYFELCSRVRIYPSVMTLAVVGLGIDRGTLYKYMRKHNNETTKLIKKAQDVIADVLSSQALINNANPAMAIFQLKNNGLGFSDNYQIQPLPPEVEEEPDIEDIADKYMGSIPTD